MSFMSTMAGSETNSNNSNEPHTPQCKYFVVRKKRLCRMTVRPGRQYCGEHEPQPNSEGSQVDKRIPCPNDPKHTCYARKLEKHLLVCNARPQQLPPYIVPNINSPQELEESPSKLLLKDVPPEILDGIIKKINELYDKHLLDKIVTVTEQPAHPSLLKDFCEPERTERSRRHLRQASSLLWLAESEELVRPDTCYVELGAGKGQVSYYAFGAWCGERGGRAAAGCGAGAGAGCGAGVGAGAGAGEGGSRVLLLDRASHRHKRDNKLRDVQHDDGGVESVSRVRADLADVCLARVPAVDACRRAIGLAKHLCGVATDYALRCMTGEGMQQKTRGLVLATCCHHRCARAAYVGRDHLQEIGITKEVFSVMLGLVSWATCGDGRSRHSRRADNSNDSNDTDDTHQNTSEESANDSYGVGNDQNVSYASETDKHDAQQQDTNNKKRRRDSEAAAGEHEAAPPPAPQQGEHDDALPPTPQRGEHDDAMSVDEEDYDSLDDDDLLDDDDDEPDDDNADAPRDENAGSPARNTANRPDDDSDDEIPAVIRRRYPRGHFRRDLAARRALLGYLQQAGVLRDMLLGDPELWEYVNEKYGNLVKKKLKRKEREEIGRRAKALLDWGRVMYLRRRGFRAKLCYYVPASVSPENICIVAKKI